MLFFIDRFDGGNFEKRNFDGDNFDKRNVDGGNFDKKPVEGGSFAKLFVGSVPKTATEEDVSSELVKWHFFLLLLPKTEVFFFFLVFYRMWQFHLSC